MDSSSSHTLRSRPVISQCILSRASFLSKELVYVNCSAYLPYTLIAGTSTSFHFHDLRLQKVSKDEHLPSLKPTNKYLPSIETSRHI